MQCADLILRLLESDDTRTTQRAVFQTGMLFQAFAMPQCRTLDHQQNDCSSAVAQSGAQLCTEMGFEHAGGFQLFPQLQHHMATHQGLAESNPPPLSLLEAPQWVGCRRPDALLSGLKNHKLVITAIEHTSQQVYKPRPGLVNTVDTTSLVSNTPAPPPATASTRLLPPGPCQTLICSSTSPSAAASLTRRCWHTPQG